MYCQKCGKQIEEGSRFCPYCGSKNMSEPEQEREKQQPAPVKKEKKCKNGLVDLSRIKELVPERNYLVSIWVFQNILLKTKNIDIPVKCELSERGKGMILAGGLLNYTKNS